MIERFRAEKDRRGLLDYEDLIDKTLDLLNNVSAAWVHYKLDRGIHHVLIDEAQDTSPKQWEIVKALVGEFFAGAGRARPAAHDLRGRRREAVDLLVPGRGAARVRRDARAFQEPHDRARARVSSRPSSSTRSAPARTCWAPSTRCSCRPHAHAGLTADPVPPVHEALPEAAPGLVEIWELAKSDERNDDRALGCAVRHRRTQPAATVKLARRIAGIGRGVAAPGPARQGRADPGAAARRAVRGDHPRAEERGRPGRRRRPAGADRAHRGDGPDGAGRRAAAAGGRSGAGDGAQEPAVRPRRRRSVQARLGSQGQPARGAARAAARSRGAARRAAPMRRARSRRSRSTPTCSAPAAGESRSWRGSATRPTTRSTNSSISRSTTSARETPSLQGFVAWLRAAQAEVKRDMEMARDEVRVMTVHGAKGLEAPIVILADTTTPPQGWHPPKLLSLPAEQGRAGYAGAAGLGRREGQRRRPDGGGARDRARRGARRIPAAALRRDDARDRTADRVRRRRRAASRRRAAGTSSCVGALKEHCVDGAGRRRRGRGAALSQDAGCRGAVPQHPPARRRRRSRSPAG